MKELNGYERGFIEASIDTDGGIYLERKKNTLHIAVRIRFFNNSKEFLDKIQEILGTNKNYVRRKGSRNKNLILGYSNNDCRWILPQLKLVIKEEKRKIALELLESIRNGNNQYTITDVHKEKKSELFHKFRSL